MAPLRVLDATNTVVWSWEDREPFGGNTPTSSMVGGQPFTFNLRFPGQWYDEETGLASNGYRDYDASMGRYLEVDPLGLAAGMNPYGYVGGDPLMDMDLYGLWGLGDPLPQGFVDFTAGFGDSLSLGLTDKVRDALGTNDVVKKCDVNYGSGEVAGTIYSALLPIGRLTYVAKVSRISKIEGITGQAASEMRNTLKDYFRGPLAKPLKNWHYKDYDILSAEGRTEEQIIASSSRTSPRWTVGIVTYGSSTTYYRANQIGKNGE